MATAFVFSTNFNSSMVRLIVAAMPGATPTNHRFQFQYGTVDSVKDPSDWMLSALFQFQYGTVDRREYSLEESS